MDIKKQALVFLFMACYFQSSAQTVEVVTNGVSAFYFPMVEIKDGRICRFEEPMTLYYDWNPSTEEIATGLWIAKLFSRYQLSIPSKKEEIANVIEFPAYPPPDFSIQGVSYTNFHIRVTPFIMRSFVSSNSLKCIQVSYFVTNKSKTDYIYSVYATLNTGVGDLMLKCGILTFSPPYYALPLLSGDDIGKQKLFIYERNSSAGENALKVKSDSLPQPDDEIVIQTDL